MKRIILIALACFANSSHADYDISKTSDWKWHAYICKNTIIHLSAVSDLQEKFGKERVDSQKTYLKQSIVESVPKNEKEIKLDQTDARLIADMVFSIRLGLEKGGFPLNQHVLMNTGFNLCIYSLDQMDKELLKPNKK